MAWKDWSYPKIGAGLGLVIGSTWFFLFLLFTVLCQGESCLAIILWSPPLWFLGKVALSEFTYKLIGVLSQLVSVAIIVGLCAFIGFVVQELKK